MANRFMTNREVNAEIVAPFLRAMAADLEECKGRTVTFTCLPDCVPVQAEASPEIIAALLNLAGELEQKSTVDERGK